MKIITDTREIRNQHILAEFSKQDTSFKIKKLHFGDYSIEGHENNIIIERKASLTELAGNFCKGRKRFEAEFIRAKEAGAKIYLLIEDSESREKMLLRRDLEKCKNTQEKKQFLIERYIKLFPEDEPITHKVNKFVKKLESLDIEQYILDNTWKSKFYANSMIASLASWKEKYDLNIVFCSKKESGKVIIDIFQKYLEEATQ